jgi:signal transduction histidine kinase
MDWASTRRRLLGIDDAGLAGVAGVCAAVVLIVGAVCLVFASRQGYELSAALCLATALTSAVAIGITWHAMRTRARALESIRHALMAVATGENEPEVLMLGENQGPHAAAWNLLLDELLTLRRARMLADATPEELASSRRDDGLRSSCDALWHGLLVVDQTLRVQYANGAAGAILGVARDTLLGSDLAGIITEAGALEALASLAGEETPAMADARPAAPKSKVVVQSSLVDAGENREAAVFRLTARRMPGSALRVVLIEDITQQKIADSSHAAFVTQATHELRTPLTNIRLYAENMVDKPEMTQIERAEHLNIITGESRRLERLVGDMLSVSEIEAGTMTLMPDDLRLEEMLKQVEQDFRFPAKSKGLTLKLNLPAKLPVIKADQKKVVLAVGNLLANALKYTPSGGSVTLSAKATNEQVIIEVADTGIGISPSEVEMVFERFYRAKDPRLQGTTGTGLGLPLARQLARLHGGEVTLQSTLNKGSTFTLTLPLKLPLALAA